MKRKTALGMISDYADYARRQGDTCSTVTDVMNRWPADGSTDKAMRWLGFMQGVMWSAGYYTLAEIKAHSRRATENEGTQ